MNLCINAKDTMPDGGTLSVADENVVVNGQFVKKDPEAELGVFVVIRVTDTGKRLPHTELDKLFGPFYTTKSLGHVTRLGTCTALGIIKSHLGFILVEGGLCFGMTFKKCVLHNSFVPARSWPPNHLDVARPRTLHKTLERSSGSCK
jgi:two-component system, cell cycle sensor histidine kinase and response regulator CckA